MILVALKVFAFAVLFICTHSQYCRYTRIYINFNFTCVCVPSVIDLIFDRCLDKQIGLGLIEEEKRLNSILVAYKWHLYYNGSVWLLFNFFFQNQYIVLFFK